MFGYIYLTTNLINNKKYIGQHRAQVFTENYKGSGKVLKQAFEKYGWSNFKVELIEECFSEDDLNQAEIRWIAQFDATHSKEFYNIAYGGAHSWHPLQSWEKEQRSLQMKKRWEDPEYRKEISQMLHEKQKDGKSWMIGKKHSEETKKKMSQSRSGSLHPMYGKIHSKESRQKMSDAAKARSRRPTTLGRIWINNGKISKSVKQEDLSYYFSQGFVKGRLSKYKNL